MTRLSCIAFIIAVFTGLGCIVAQPIIEKAAIRIIKEHMEQRR